MGKRLQSMDVTIEDVTRTFEFDPPVKVESDDEGEASLELLREAETTEVVLVGGIDSATVNVRFTYQVTGEVEVQLDSSDLDGIDEVDEIRSGAERGDFDGINDAIDREVEANVAAFENAVIDAVDVVAYDEDGNEVDD